ncbi:hypothetical protein SAMN04487907_105215 [Zunongwangia mangrovi]|uniref:Uncharacterized protein n=1 Tax=Zunongwangia mangrovi TaxID=1334022 RepID=A0A1I1K4T2_9FLAO|nr:hypothetical protein SAMN04487907_105215 [Zunongwangia mangrovi]
MRLVIFFISFLVLSLSSFPCCLLEEVGENSVCIENSSNSQDDPSSNEVCSPFLNCGSCTGFAIQEYLEITFIQDELSLTVLPSYQELFKSAYQNPDFKPPKPRLYKLV